MEALKMEGPMDTWNDARLDELSGRVDGGFTKVDERFDKVDERFKQVDERFDKVDERFAEVASKEDLKEVKDEIRILSGRIDRLLHAFAMVAATFGIGVLATLGGVVVAQL